MPTLRPKELCPLHRRRDCCGRAEVVRYSQPRHEIKFRLLGDGTRVFPDGREVCPPAVLRKRKMELARNCPFCPACGNRFESMEEVELAHRESKGMGAAKRRDNWDNLVLLHVGANRAQGSMSLKVYLNEFWKPEHCR